MYILYIQHTHTIAESRQPDGVRLIMAASLQRTLGPFNINRFLSPPKRASLRYITAHSIHAPSLPDPPPSPQHERRSRLPSDFLSSLRARHPGLDVSINPYDLDSHGRGESHHPTAAPDAVVRPTRIEEVRDILTACCRERRVKGEDLPIVEIVSVIPYGAGATGLSLFVRTDIFLSCSYIV
jgi:hypothetical protein